MSLSAAQHRRLNVKSKEGAQEMLLELKCITYIIQASFLELLE